MFGLYEFCEILRTVIVDIRRLLRRFYVDFFNRTLCVRISTLGRSLPSDSRLLDAVSGADVTAPGGPRARRFLLTQPLRAIFCRVVVAVVEEDIKTVSSRLMCVCFISA